MRGRCQCYPFKGFYSTKRITCRFGKAKVVTRRAKEKGLQEALAKMQVLLELDPQDPSLQTLHAITEIELKTDMKEHAKWMMKTAQLKWLDEGKQCPTYIFSNFEQQAIQRDVHAMRDEHGVLQTSWEGIANVMRNHYMDLLDKEVPLDEVALEKVLQAQVKTIPKEAQEAMEQPVTLEELFVVATQLNKQKVPGRDGLPIEFSLAVWD